GIRFTHSPSGGGGSRGEQMTNPAWDFSFLLPKYEGKKKYGFRAPGVDPQRCSRAQGLQEFESWRERRWRCEPVRRPARFEICTIFSFPVDVEAGFALISTDTDDHCEVKHDRAPGPGIPSLPPGQGTTGVPPGTGRRPDGRSPVDR